MAEIIDVAAYIIQTYPHKHELSNARLTKLVYLADWKHSLEHRRQITDINWYFDNYGPFVKDVREALEKRRDIFKVEEGANIHGAKKVLFGIASDKYAPKLNENEKKSIDHVLNVTRKLYWDDFIKLVYATHPVASSDRYSFLDLPKKAIEYKSATPG